MSDEHAKPFDRPWSWSRWYEVLINSKDQGFMRVDDHDTGIAVERESEEVRELFYQQQRASLQFIVHAVNNHDALVTALRNMLANPGTRESRREAIAVLARAEDAHHREG